jgi:HEAT repeat protein
MHDENILVMASAKNALDEIGYDNDAVPYLKGLKDLNSSSRRKAAAAIGYFSDARAIDSLVEALKDNDPLVREKAAWALGIIDDDTAADPLIRALKDSEPSVRQYAVWALGKMDEIEAIDPIIEALKDDNSGVRGEAARIDSDLNIRFFPIHGFYE